MTKRRFVPRFSVTEMKVETEIWALIKVKLHKYTPSPPLHIDSKKVLDKHSKHYYSFCKPFKQ